MKFLEALGGYAAFVLPWSLLFRECVLRRENKAGAALKVILEGIEAASKSSSRACLNYLWLEKGFCQESGGLLLLLLKRRGGVGGSAFGATTRAWTWQWIAGCTPSRRRGGSSCVGLEWRGQTEVRAG